MTQYELHRALENGKHVFLWGFGVFFGNDKEGLFIPRSAFTPYRTTGHVELHNKDSHPFSDPCFDVGLLVEGLTWFAKYEDWIARRMPGHYRWETLKDFPRLTHTQSDLGSSWRALAGYLSQESAPARSPQIA
jgi:hypothetical protein